MLRMLKLVKWTHSLEHLVHSSYQDMRSLLMVLTYLSIEAAVDPMLLVETIRPIQIIQTLLQIQTHYQPRLCGDSIATLVLVLLQLLIQQLTQVIMIMVLVLYLIHLNGQYKESFIYPINQTQLVYTMVVLPILN